MKIVTVLGARPQFIKAGSVSREIIRRTEGGEPIREVIVNTGQHFDANMSRIFFEDMKIPEPDYNLGIGGKSHGAMTGQMIEGTETILLDEKPDYVVVYGDTNSTLAGAIAASKLHIKIAHIEAGLRSFNIYMPEEINRILTDRVSRYLFCPTKTAVKNLENEGASGWGGNASVLLSGDVMLDGALFYRELASKPTELSVHDSFVLATVHRAENTDDPEHLENIISALNEISAELQIVMPLHPRTRKKLDQGNLNTTNVTFIEPVGYMNMIWLIDHCTLVMTDSGGLQKEAFFFGKPCITLRDETEWVELVELGFNKLAGANKNKILEMYRNAEFNHNYDKNLYGNGKASKYIVNVLLNSADHDP